MTRKVDEVEARNLGARLRAARIRRGFTLEYVANECGLHYTHVSKIERGMFRFENQNVQIICKFVGLNLEPPMPPLRSDLHVKLDRLVAQRPDAALAISALFDALDKLTAD